eukprot:scaffold870_cov268-Pinguiococcus_pyrenoidosus.AAC.32
MIAEHFVSRVCETADLQPWLPQIEETDLSGHRPHSAFLVASRRSSIRVCSRGVAGSSKMHQHASRAAERRRWSGTHPDPRLHSSGCPSALPRRPGVASRHSCSMNLPPAQRFGPIQS